jgi:hypothetical protein
MKREASHRLINFSPNIKRGALEANLRSTPSSHPTRLTDKVLSKQNVSRELKGVSNKGEKEKKKKKS